MTYCYKICNTKYSVTNPQRGYCKKGCDSEEETLYFSIFQALYSNRADCKSEDCEGLCIKNELGEEDAPKLGSN